MTSSRRTSILASLTPKKSKASVLKNIMENIFRYHGLAKHHYQRFRATLTDRYFQLRQMGALLFATLEPTFLKSHHTYPSVL